MINLLEEAVDDDVNHCLSVQYNSQIPSSLSVMPALLTVWLASRHSQSGCKEKGAKYA